MSGKNNNRSSRVLKNIILICLELVLLAVTAGFMYVAFTTTDKVEKIKVDTDSIIVNDGIKKDIEPESGVINVAFFGVDSRDKDLGKGTRSDTIMIMSLNRETKEIKLYSLYRDTFLNLGNDSYNKCNTAYAKGGPEQAINMLNMNLDLDITQYVTVGFAGLIEAIDALGGIDVNVKEEEIIHLNNYQISMSGESEDGINFTAVAGKDYIPVTEPGMQTLNGLQATAYCRIRYVGDDYQRAERQRSVLISMLIKAKTASVMTLKDVVNAVLPNIQTNLDIGEFLPLLSTVPSYNVVTSEGLPYASNRTTAVVGAKGDCIVPLSLEDNVRMLHDSMYGEEGYEPSDAVKEYSEAIKETTNPYLK